MRRLEAHGDEHKLPATHKINALRMLTIGNSKEYFDLWEADRDHADAAKSCVELLNKVKDYPRERRSDSTAQKNAQRGSDPMDVGAAQGIWSKYHCGDCR